MSKESVKENEVYLGQIKNVEVSVIKKLRNKHLENCLATLFKDVRHEKPSTISLSSSDAGIRN